MRYGRRDLSILCTGVRVDYSLRDGELTVDLETVKESELLDQFSVPELIEHFGAQAFRDELERNYP